LRFAYGADFTARRLSNHLRRAVGRESIEPASVERLSTTL
jgi:hypothetical protein